MTERERDDAAAPQVGDQLGPRSLAFTRDTLVRYAGASGDFNPIHYSDLAAREAGLGGVIAHGMLTMGAAIDLVVQWAGDPGAILDYAVRFSRPVAVPESGEATLTVSGQVQSLDEAAGTARIALTVRHEDAKVLGKATVTCTLPRTTSSFPA